MAAPSLGHYASLSFVVIGRGHRTEIFLWERPSDAILRFERLLRLERLNYLTNQLIF